MGRWNTQDYRPPRRTPMGMGGRRPPRAWPLVAAAVGSAIGAMASPFWAMVGGALGAATGGGMNRRPTHPPARRWR